MPAFMYITSVPVAHGGQKRKSEAPELELKATMGVLGTGHILLISESSLQPSGYIFLLSSLSDVSVFSSSMALPTHLPSSLSRLLLSKSLLL